MYLKALEIQGFKSFPDKTTLVFGADITAIVGPNGSGKSNISDAIRWVMGEQSSKSLRGGKMEDVIFGGTQKRNQLGFAQVSLVLDNTGGLFPQMEESEISVTRRYYRSGDSEYYINRQSVRLRDVTDLFMDTGLGKEGYSIIGQGKIDEILSQRSSERREVFEEAAGISRYRHRKEDTERKLQRTEENLVRINDKIAEIALQVEPLREQSEKAKAFLILRDELRLLEITLWLNQLDTLKQENRTLEHTFRESQIQRDQAQEALEALYQQGEQFGAQMRQNDVDAETIRGQVTQLEGQVSQQEAQIAVTHTTIAHHQENIERAQQALAQQDSRVESLQEQWEAETARIEELEQAMGQTDLALDALMTQALEASEQVGGAQAEATVLYGKAAVATAAAADQRATWTGAQSTLTQLEQRAKDLELELGDLESQDAQMRDDANICRRKLDEAREEDQAVTNIIAGYTLRIAQRQERLDIASAQTLNATMELRTMESRIHMLGEMEKEYQGFSKAVRLVMQGRLPGIHGPVGNLMTTAPDYTVAIEIALGGALQNIVVDKEEQGKSAIEYLKRRDGGRATFLPLTTIRGDELRQPGLEKMPGYVGLASQLIRFDGQYRGIFHNLLGKTVIVEDMDCGIAMARQYRNAFRIVTLDGQVLNRGGSMTGGSVNRSAGILSRSAELEGLLGQLPGVKERLSHAKTQEEDAKRTLDMANQQLEGAKEQQRTAQDAVLRFEGQHTYFKSQLASFAEKNRTLQSQKETIASQQATAQVTMLQAQQELETQEQLAADYQFKARQVMEGQSELEERSAQLAEDISQKRATLAAMQAQQEGAKRAADDLETRCQELSVDRREHEGRTKTEQLAIEQRRLEVERMVATKEGVLREIVALQENLQALQNARMALEASRTTQSRAEQTQNELLLNLERTLSKMEQKIATAALEEKQILDRLWDHYELTHSQASELTVELESISRGHRRVAEIKKSMSALGNPNIGAIEEFERVNTRYLYLTEQRDDVTQAKGDLEHIIGDITGEMEEIFRTQFNLLAENFQTTFVELFGGGHGTISLEDPKDILNCGIEIKAQPPGKTLKTISLLSGGEKAFVAIALYFAILKVHPTPFCVMDEIEAALDESNVVRYARYMRRLADKTQFIVITHRRGTMEEADVLYGVTMQEQGVSKMLTIHMNDLAKELNIK